MSKIRRIAYVSAAVKPFSSNQLEQLLLEASRSNLQSGVTGLLIHADNDFMGYIEGNPRMTGTIYEKIKKSRQHSGLIELLDQLADSRLFSDWTLVVSGTVTSAPLQDAAAKWRFRILKEGNGIFNDPAFGMLEQFWENARR